MPSAFAALDDQLSGAVDAAFAESFFFEAFTVGSDVDMPRMPDATRAAFIAPGIWDAAAKSTTPHARGATQDDNAHNWTASHPQINLADINLIWVPRAGDRATRIDTGDVYQIVRPPRADGLGRTTIQLSDRKR